MNTVIRTQASPAQQDNILRLLGELKFSADFAASVVSALHSGLNDDLYSTNGSVNLDDVSETMWSEIEAFSEPQECGYCRGTGEGAYEQRCYACAGQGEVAPLTEQAYA